MNIRQHEGLREMDAYNRAYAAELEAQGGFPANMPEGEKEARILARMEAMEDLEARNAHVREAKGDQWEACDNEMRSLGTIFKRVGIIIIVFFQTCYIKMLDR